MYQLCQLTVFDCNSPGGQHLQSGCIEECSFDCNVRFSNYWISIEQIALSDMAHPLYAFRFHIIRDQSILLRLLSQWLAMAFGWKMYVGPDNIHVTYRIRDTAVVSMFPGWPCDKCFRLTGVDYSTANNIGRGVRGHPYTSRG